VSPRRLEIGHVGPARALLDSIDDPDLAAALAERLGRRDLSGADALAARLDGVAARLARVLPRLAGSIERVREIAGAAGIDEITEPALAEIEAVLAAAREQAPDAIDAVDVSIDLGEVDGFPYYTGIRLAGWLGGVGQAVLVGGRYDQLVACYGGDRQATGFAIDIELVVQAEADPAPGPRGVLVCAEVAAARERARAVVVALRRRGFRAAFELGGLRGRRKLRTYAAQSGFERVLMVSADSAAILELDGEVAAISTNALRQTLAGKPGKLDGLLCRD
jgi:ATP phosphoribosyltransferase regulatory subunit